MSFRTHTLRRGGRAQTVLVVAEDEDGNPVTGLIPDSVRAAYVRDDGVAGAIPLVATDGAWASGAFHECDPVLAPGIYRFGLPDQVTAEGATRAIIVLQADRTSIQPVDIDIVAFDPQDQDRLGMEALAFEQRVKCLTTAFPRLAAEEQRRLGAQEQSG